MSKENDYKTFIEDEIQFYLHEAGFNPREKELFKLRVYEGKTLWECCDIMDYLPNMTGYRMGYSDGRGNNGSSYGSNYSAGNDGSRYGYEGMRNQSRYGESYDRYSDKRRHYHESGDADSKRQMDDSIEDIFNDMENMVQDVIKEMTPEQKAKYKQKMTVLAQKMQ